MANTKFDLIQHGQLMVDIFLIYKMKKLIECDQNQAFKAYLDDSATNLK